MIGILVNPNFLIDVRIISVDQPFGNMANPVILNPTDKERNPWGIKNIPYDKPIVDFVDALVLMAKRNDCKKTIERDKDWEVVDFIYKGWKVLYPQTSTEFENHMKEWRRQSTHLGVSREQGGAEIQHKFNLPMPVHGLIKSIFPQQKWDKKFIDTFAKRYGQFRGADKL